LPKEDPKSITGINQSHNLDEYEYKSYEETKFFREVYPAAARAFVLIPQMYNRLTLVDGLTHKDAIAKMRNDHGHLHTVQYIVKYAASLLFQWQLQITKLYEITK